MGLGDRVQARCVGKEVRVNPDARIASLLRELADAFDERSKEDKPKRPRLRRERTDRAAEDAARRVREGLRKQGMHS